MTLIKLSLVGIISLQFSLSSSAESAQSTQTPSDMNALEADLLEHSLNSDERLVLERFIRHAVDFAKAQDNESVQTSLDKNGPEKFCWVDFKYLNCLNIAYQLTEDTQYLDLLRKGFQPYMTALSIGPDKYLGWYGKTLPSRQPKDQPDLLVDELQTNFRAIGLLANWVENARQDSAYASANAATIEAYLSLIEDHLFPKWDARGHFEVIHGRGGLYRALDYPRTIENSLSFEKLSIMIDGLLPLHRVTGKDTYLKRALQIGAWYKSNLILKDDHYEWMSWVPAGDWDIHPTKEDAWTVSWMAPDPNSAWYVTAMSIALNLYRHGLLFDEADLERFITTQKVMCWNGDMNAPVYRNVSGEKNEHVKGRYLSYQISNYDETLRQLAFYGPHEEDQLADSEKSWQGSANAQDYVTEKYLLQSLLRTNPQPFSKTGADFLEKPENKTFYRVLNFKVVEPGAVPTRKPSDLYVRP